MSKRFTTLAIFIIFFALSQGAKAFEPLGFFKDLFVAKNSDEGDSHPLVEIERMQRPSLSVLEKLGGSDFYDPSNASHNCRYSNSEDALERFSDFETCSISGVYEEKVNESVADYLRPEALNENLVEQAPQAYFLGLRDSGVERFCNCTKSKEHLLQLGPTSDKQTSRRAEVLDNIVKGAMKKISDRFENLQEKVGYALSSHEFLSLTTQERESADSSTPSLENVGTLSLCMAPEMMGLLKQGQNQDGQERLCGEKGFEKLVKGIRGAHAPNCQNGGLGCDTPNRVARSDFNEKLFQIVERHSALDRTPYTEFRPTRRGVRQVQRPLGRLEFQHMRRPESSQQSFRSGAYNESVRTMIEKSLSNERSLEGQKLWDLNNAPILEALEEAKKNDGVVDIAVFEQVDLDHFSKYLEYNPYLREKLISNAQGQDLKDKSVLKAALKSYIETDLYKRYLADTHNNHPSVLMGLTFATDYLKTLNECEQLQKTMVSLCRALDQDGDEDEKLSPLFTDSRLVALFSDELQAMQKGAADEAAYSEFGAASYYFCEDVEAQGIKNINQRQEQFDESLALNPLFRGMDRDRYKIYQMATQEGENLSQQLSQRSVQLRDASVAVKISSGEETAERFERVHSVIEVSGSRAQRAQQSQEQTISTVSSESRKAKRIETIPEVVESDQDLNETSQGPEEHSDSDQGVEVQSAEQKQKTANETDRGQQLNPVEAQQERAAQFRPNPQQYNYLSNALDPEDEQSSQEVAKEQADALASMGGQDGILKTPVSSEQDLQAKLLEMQQKEAQLQRELEELQERFEQEEEEKAVAEQEQKVEELKKEMAELRQQLASAKESEDSNKNESRAATNNSFSQDRAARDLETARVRVRPKENPNQYYERRIPNVSESFRDQASKGVPTNPKQVPEGAAAAPSRSSAASGQETGSSQGLTLSGQAFGPQQRSAQNAPTQVAPPDASLTTLALSAQGHVVIRQTENPEIYERIVFKQENGEIVYDNGHPVVDLTETLEASELELELEAEPESAPSKAARAPASINDELIEIERQIRPRASHQELIETLQKNTQNN